MPQKCPCRQIFQHKRFTSYRAVKCIQLLKTKKNFGKKFLASTTTRKIRWIHWWNPFLNPLTITGDICNFVTTVSALSNMSQRSVYNYRRVGRYFALGNTCPVQLFLVLNYAHFNKMCPSRNNDIFFPNWYNQCFAWLRLHCLTKEVVQGEGI